MLVKVIIDPSEEQRDNEEGNTSFFYFRFRQESLLVYGSIYKFPQNKQEFVTTNTKRT